MTDASRRLVVGTLAVLVVVGGVAADATIGRTAPSAALVVPADAVVAGPAAATSVWYCAGSAVPEAGEKATIVLADAGARAVSGVITAFAPVTDAVSKPSAPAQFIFSVTPQGQASFALPWSGAAEVFVNGGGVLAQELLSGSAGWSEAPCVSTTSTAWYFAHGSTASGASLSLTLFNPTATDAVVDVSLFSQTAGLIEPPAYQGVPVPAGSAVVETLGDHDPNDESLATEVTTLSGTIVAAEVANQGPSNGDAVSLLNGVTSPATRWAVPGNAPSSGGSTVFTIFNPSAGAQTVSAVFSFPSGKSQTLSLSVPGHAATAVPAGPQLSSSPSSPFAATFSVHSGPGVVVSREVSAMPGQPAPVDGLTVAEPFGARQWLVPPLSPPGTSVLGLSVVNLAGRRVHVTVSVVEPGGVLLPLASQGSFALAAGAMASDAAWTRSPVGTALLEVLADGPVAVELDPGPAGAMGTVYVPSFPVVAISPSG